MIQKTISTITKGIICLVLIFSTTQFAHAQRVAVIDLVKILDSSNDYKTAQNELDKLAMRWRQEIAQEHDKIKSMYNKYQAEQVLMSEDLRKEKEEEIMTKEKEVRELQKKKFGPEGELFKKRQDLVKPIQERVYSVIEDFATKKGFDVVFDTEGNIIYYDSRYDKTEDILTELGAK